MGIQPLEASPYTNTRSKSKTTFAEKAQAKNCEATNEDPSSPPSPLPKSASRKRKQPSSAQSAQSAQSEGEINGETIQQVSSKKQKSAAPMTASRKKGSPKKKDEEKRLRHFRSHAPGTYLQRLKRAQSQRMFVIKRARNIDNPSHPSETISMAGTTGNIYTITITHLPTCTCPDNRKGNQCKHIVYALHNVLKAPPNLQYQLAFLTPELQQIFTQAPPLPTSSPANTETNNDPSNRKEISGDCPICFMEFAPATEEIIFCRAACGNNIHKQCFEQWARAQASGSVKCVYCRTPWLREVGDYESLAKGGKEGEEGYVNIGKELGLSGMRDMSSYHQYWVRGLMGRRGRRGGLDDDFDYDD
ncbi:MAG: hypothetical protein Q9192_008055 [Flavoplaca navasiana]